MKKITNSNYQAHQEKVEKKKKELYDKMNDKLKEEGIEYKELATNGYIGSDNTARSLYRYRNMYIESVISICIALGLKVNIE